MIKEIKMLTDKTQKAIGILHEIAYYGSQPCSDKGDNHVCTPLCTVILEQLRVAGIIRLLSGAKPDSFQSYRLCKELSKISLYQLLTAIGEGINLVVPNADEERIYKHYHYGTGASRLGVINQMLRTMLCDVNLLDL